MKLSIIIPTLNRDKDLCILLRSIVIQTVKPFEIFVIDQSDDNLTKCLCAAYSDFLPIIYIYSSIKSSTHSRNIGVNKSSGDVLVFLDDDTKLTSNYLEQILGFYNDYPDAIGAMSKILNQNDLNSKIVGKGFIFQLYKFISTLFFLNSYTKGFRILPSGRNTMDYDSKKPIRAEWLSGVSWYKKEIFDEFQFEERFIKYAFGEDKMLSYQIYKKYPGSLYYYPKAMLYHYESPASRLTGKDKIYLKVLYHHWFYYKCLNKHYFLFWWGNFGEIILHFMNACMFKESFSNSWHYLFVNILMIKERRIVKNGKFMSFINKYVLS